MSQSYFVYVDGSEWLVSSAQSEYDAIHAAAGAVLAGAEKVTIERVHSREGEKEMATDGGRDVDAVDECELSVKRWRGEHWLEIIPPVGPATSFRIDTEDARGHVASGIISKAADEASSRYEPRWGYEIEDEFVERVAKEVERHLLQGNPAPVRSVKDGEGGDSA